MCATDSLEPLDLVVCLVEIEGKRGFPASCTTPVEEGMVVHTQTPNLQKLRKGVMELYISDHPLDCLTCSKNGELQDMAGVTGLRDVRYGVDDEAEIIVLKLKMSRIHISPMTQVNVLFVIVVSEPAKKLKYLCINYFITWV